MGNLTVRLIASDDGGYTATIDECPGCISEGDTAAEALRNLAEAYALWSEQ